MLTGQEKLYAYQQIQRKRAMYAYAFVQARIANIRLAMSKGIDVRKHPAYQAEYLALVKQFGEEGLFVFEQDNNSVITKEEGTTNG